MMQGGMGPQGMALLQAALARKPTNPVGGQTGGMPQGLISEIFDPQNPGGKDGILAMIRGMQKSPGGVPMSLAPPNLGLLGGGSPLMPGMMPDVQAPW